MMRKSVTRSFAFLPAGSFNCMPKWMPRTQSEWEPISGFHFLISILVNNQAKFQYLRTDNSDWLFNITSLALSLSSSSGSPISRPCITCYISEILINPFKGYVCPQIHVFHSLDVDMMVLIWSMDWVLQEVSSKLSPDSKFQGANMGPTWVLSAPDGPHVGPMNLAIRVVIYVCSEVPQPVCNFMAWQKCCKKH